MLSASKAIFPSLLKPSLTSLFRNMSRVIVATPDAPAAVGPYSQGIKAGNTLYVSGCIGLEPKSMEFNSDNVEGQAEQCLKNMAAVLKAGDSSFDKVLKTTVLLVDMADFAKVNAVYEKYMGTTAPPARACFAVRSLPKGALVEIDAVALCE